MTRALAPEHDRTLHELRVLEQHRDDLLLRLVVGGVETELTEPLVLAHQRRRRVGDGVDDALEVGASSGCALRYSITSTSTPWSPRISSAPRDLLHTGLWYTTIGSDQSLLMRAGYRSPPSGNVAIGGRATAAATSSRYRLAWHVDGTERRQVRRRPLHVEQRCRRRRACRSTSATTATFDASVTRWNFDSAANRPPMLTPYSPPTSASAPPSSTCHVSTLCAHPSRATRCTRR